MSKIFRKIFLGLAKNRKIDNVINKHGIKLGMKKFIAGDTLSEAEGVVETLNHQRIKTSLHHLGENVQSKEEAIKNKNLTLVIMEQIRQKQLDSDIAIKLSGLGLVFGEKYCLSLVEPIIKEAKKKQLFIRIDMEEYQWNESILTIFEKLVKKYKHHVGLTIQASLYKSERDASFLQKYKSNLSVCKGTYKESDRVSFAKKEEIEANFLKIMELQMEHGHFVGIATHDETVLSFVEAYAKAKRIPKEQFEFQFLYGVREERQLELARKGYQVRVYVPFGKEGYAYYMRRLATKPTTFPPILSKLWNKKEGLA